MPQRTSLPDSTFAHAHGIVLGSADDWFNPKLHADTDLFIDPFLMFKETVPPWDAVQDRMIDFFNTAMEHVASAGRNQRSREWQRAAAMFSFPEPPEFCLGYGANTIFGAGSARGLGQLMLKAAQEAIDAGLDNINDFGELLLFGEGFGSDRISDMVCNIAKDDFVRYTQDVATRHSVAVEGFKVEHHGFDFQFDRWSQAHVDLPRNPCWNRRTAVLLTPKRFLSELPRMDDGAFWDWVYDNQNEQLRNDLGYLVTKGLKKKEILRLARRRMTLRRKYGAMYAAANRADPPTPYDFAKDPAFKVTGLETAQAVADTVDLTVPSNQEQFCTFVSALAVEFKDTVENRGIWRSFWSGDNPRPENLAQDMFHMSVLRACKDRDIDLSPETNAGTGPVDFKFSAGWSKRALVELKLAKSSSFWDNLEHQTPTYLTTEGIACGYIVIIQHYDRHCTPEFVARVDAIAQRVSNDVGWTYVPVFVDVRPKASASKRRTRS